jgi:hypothetical protein
MDVDLSDSSQQQEDSMQSECIAYAMSVKDGSEA